MARIYIASSWRNAFQPVLVEELRKRGHLVYDFRHPQGRDDKSVWEEIGVDETHGIKMSELINDLNSSDEANDRFDEHFAAMQDADTCVLLLPCGRSAHTEAGFMSGQGKRVFVLGSEDDVRPELMYLMFEDFFSPSSLEDDSPQGFYSRIAEPQPGICRICGCSSRNACYHPTVGSCWWVDDECTLCSHCYEDMMRHPVTGRFIHSIAHDPNTRHCIADEGKGFRQFYLKSQQNPIKK